MATGAAPTVAAPSGRALLGAPAGQGAQPPGLRLGFINPVIYRIARSPSYHKAFHNITTGTNGYPAAPGWDPVTGWGTPHAHVLIPLLSRNPNAGNG